MTIEGLKNYRMSNRRIGDFLKELRLTEGRNTGFRKIVDALAANGSPKPEFQTDDTRTYFITRLFFMRNLVKYQKKVTLKVALKVALMALKVALKMAC